MTEAAIFILGAAALWVVVAAAYAILPALCSGAGCVAMANAAAKLAHLPSTDINNLSLLFCVGVCVVAGVATWFLLQQAPLKFRRAMAWT